MNILVVTNMWPRPDAPWYGAFVKEQVDALIASGASVDVHLIEGWRAPSIYLAAPRALARRLRRKPPDIIHAHHGFSAWVALRARRRAGVHAPVASTLHDGDLFAPPTVPTRLVHRLTRRLRLRAAARSDLTIVVNPSHVVPGARRCACLPCGVDLRRFAPMDREGARQRLADLGASLAGDAQIFFPACPDRPEKRADLARAAAERLRAEGRPAQVAWGGAISLEDMPLHYNAADLTLLTSDYEASPMALKEALACEARVVSRRVGDAPGLLKGLDGAALCGDTPDDIAHAVGRVLDAPRPTAGRLRLSKLELTHDAVASRLLSLYREVTGAKSSPI